MTNVPTPPAEPAAAAITHAKARSAVIPLEWPLVIDGKTLSEVTVKRLTTKEVAAFLDSVKDAAEDQETRFPIFYDAAGIAISDAVFDQLDDDDTVRLNKAALDFLPRRFRPAATDISVSGPEAGAPTEPSSAGS